MSSFTLAISGSGGAGAISTGEMLLRAAARRGYYGMLKKTFSPQIRGGEAAAIVRLGNRPIANFDGRIDLLVALDWQNFSRFADEVPVSAGTLVLQNSGAGELPVSLAARTDLVTVDGAGVSAGVDSDWVNLVVLGLLAAALGCAAAEVEQIALQRLAKYDQPLRAAAGRAVLAGFDLPAPLALTAKLAGFSPAQHSDNRWLASGNQMAALGALEAGIRFVAAYPITPASDLLEWLALHIEPLGGHLLQAEDELAAVNMAIGAGFGGVPAMTATSGPGLALMSEAMGLAVASETPLVVLDVMRGGPSTGIPTKSEQSDLNLALYGLHGDAPHIVLACHSIADCHFTTAWAVALATRLQTLVIVLSDQFLGQSMQVIEAPGTSVPQASLVHGAELHRGELHGAEMDRVGEGAADAAYLRYEDTPSGISAMAVPGDAGLMFTADGLEHSQNAVPSPRASEHQRQLDKRLRKLVNHDYGDRWAELQGVIDGNPLLICWGSVSGSALEARQALAADGTEVAVLCLRLLSPLPEDKLAGLLARASELLVIEQNHGAQLLHYLRSRLPEFHYGSLARPGPTLITPADIIHCLELAHVS